MSQRRRDIFDRAAVREEAAYEMASSRFVRRIRYGGVRWLVLREIFKAMYSARGAQHVNFAETEL